MYTWREGIYTWQEKLVKIAQIFFGLWSKHVCNGVTLSEPCSVLLLRSSDALNAGGIPESAGCWSNSAVTEVRAADFSKSRFISVLALFEENKLNSSAPKLSHGFKDCVEWLMCRLVVMNP